MGANPLSLVNFSRKLSTRTTAFPVATSAPTSRPQTPVKLKLNVRRAKQHPNKSPNLARLVPRHTIGVGNLYLQHTQGLSPIIFSRTTPPQSSAPQNYKRRASIDSTEHINNTRSIKLYSACYKFSLSRTLKSTIRQKFARINNTFQK